jgi:iron complex outermembrane recepter protein
LNSTRVSFLTLLLTTALASSPALAVDATTPDAPSPADMDGNGNVVQEIIVTAEKRSERLSKVPMSVTAATGDQLLQQGITNPAGLTKLVPGFNFTESTYGAPVYTLRGIGTYDEAIAISPAVGVYMDQIPLPFARMTEGVSLDLQRVEVLKGPQGTLFGENSTGGAVNYIPNRPTDHFAAGGSVSYGRFNETDAEGYLSGPLSDAIRARVALRTEQRSDWQYNYTNGDTLGHHNFTTARVLVDFDPTDRLKWSLNVNGWFDKSDVQVPQKIGYAQITPGGYPGAPGFPNIQAQLRAFPNAPANDRAAAWDIGGNFQRNDGFVQTGLRGDWQVADNVTITSLTSYSHLKVNTPADSDGTNYPDSYVVVFGKVDSVTQELRSAGQTASDSLKWMVGLNYEYDHSNDNQFIGLHSTNSGVGPFRFTGLYNINEQKVNTEAVFGNLEYNIVDTVTLQGSARYTNQTRKFHGGLTDDGNGDLAAAFGFVSTLLSGSPTVIPPGGYVTLDPATNKPLTNGLYSQLDQHNVSWKVGVSWKPTDDYLLYVNATKGYKAGAFGTLPVIRPDQDAPVTQESVLAYEGGFKVTAFHRAAQFTGAVFHYDYDNKQLLGSKFVGLPFGTLPALVNIPRSSIDGAELDVTARPFENFKVRVGGTYLDSKVKGSYMLSSPISGPPVDIGGEPFPATPKWGVNSDAEYDHPISSQWTAYLGAGLTYNSATPGAFGNIPSLEMPSYTLLDVRAGVNSDRWEIQLWGRNITDRYYLTHAFRPTDTLIRTTGFPATYGITVSAHF